MVQRLDISRCLNRRDLDRQSDRIQEIGPRAASAVDTDALRGGIDLFSTALRLAYRTYAPGTGAN